MILTCATKDREEDNNNDLTCLLEIQIHNMNNIIMSTLMSETGAKRLKLLQIFISALSLIAYYKYKSPFE